VNKVIADLAIVGLDPSSLFELFGGCPAIYTNTHSAYYEFIDFVCLCVALMK